MPSSDSTRFSDEPRIRRIAIDLTPMRAGGENGGAKLMTMEVIRYLGLNTSAFEFILLTTNICHHELASLDAWNVHRCCVTGYDLLGPEPEAPKPNLITRLKTAFANNSEQPVKGRLNESLQAIANQTASNKLLKAIDADLLFCPFTAAYFFDPTVPAVSVVYDLQHRYYPQFFSLLERQQRDRNFKETCRLASCLVTISNFVRNTVIDQDKVPGERVVTAYIRLSRRLSGDAPSKISKRSYARALSYLDKYGLKPERFLFFPANFWQHKNHAMLLTAFGMYRAAHPQSTLKLVCTGAPDARMDALIHAAEQMGLTPWVVFAGYVPDPEFSALLENCKALIFPSLYEGFGMPLLEAMEHGKPVMCSNVTSLPEVASDAALLFDPRKPGDIVHAIARIENEPELAKSLIEKGYLRVATFGGGSEMANEYLQIFRDVIASPSHFELALHNVYPDKWTTDRFVFTYDASTVDRRLEFELLYPPWVPHEEITVNVLDNGHHSPEIYAVKRGQINRISHPLPHNTGYLEFIFSDVFQPKAMGMGKDIRMLGGRFKTCQVVSPGESIDMFEIKG